MKNVDEFRGSLEMLLADKKRKLEYYHEKINDYVNRAENATLEIAKLEAALNPEDKEKENALKKLQEKMKGQASLVQDTAKERSGGSH